MNPSLRVRFPVELGIQVFGRLLAEFMREQPELTVELQLSDQLHGLEGDPPDLAVGRGPANGEQFATRKMTALAGGLYASPHYIEQHGEPTSTEALAAHARLRYHARPDGDETARSRRRRQSSAALVVSANNFTVLREAAICGLGVVCLPHILCSDAVQARQLRRILPDTGCICDGLDLYASWPRPPHDSQIAHLLLDHIDRRLRQLTADAATAESASNSNSDFGS